MGARIRIGLWSAGVILLVVLVFAGIVWRDVEGYTQIRRGIDPAVGANELVVRAELAEWPSITIHPGVAVQASCEGESSHGELWFRCTARRVNRQ